MQIIAELARRKTLVAAGAAILVGAVLVARSLLAAIDLAAPSASADAPAVALDAPLEESFDVLVGGAGEPGAAQPEAGADVLVYVTGAVAAPDVYRLPADARVKDLVLAAGGLSADADMQAINLAARLADGEHVDVPRIGAGPVEPAGAPGGEAAGLLNINTADAGELDGLPGIGPAIAERIIAHREANGPFASVDDLQEVKGIGAALFETIAPLVTVGL